MSNPQWRTTLKDEWARDHRNIAENGGYELILPGSLNNCVPSEDGWQLSNGVSTTHSATADGKASLIKSLLVFVNSSLRDSHIRNAVGKNLPE